MQLSPVQVGSQSWIYIVDCDSLGLADRIVPVDHSPTEFQNSYRLPYTDSRSCMVFVVACQYRLKIIFYSLEIIVCKFLPSKYLREYVNKKILNKLFSLTNNYDIIVARNSISTDTIAYVHTVVNSIRTLLTDRTVAIIMTFVFG
jgi:hypothetical protein